MTDTPSTGDVIGQIDRYLKRGKVAGALHRIGLTLGFEVVDPRVGEEAARLLEGEMVAVKRSDLEGWHDCVVEAAARLDPDNPPLTPEQLARMRRKEPQ